jgi:hypothetical protein
VLGERVIAALVRRAAQAAELHGAVPTTAAAHTVVTVDQHQTQQATAVSVVAIEELMAWDGCPTTFDPYIRFS